MAKDNLGLTERLEDIAVYCNNIERKEAAQRVLEKRARRKEFMDKGLTFEQACLIVNSENNL